MIAAGRLLAVLVSSYGAVRLGHYGLDDVLGWVLIVTGVAVTALGIRLQGRV